MTSAEFTVNTVSPNVGTWPLNFNHAVKLNFCVTDWIEPQIFSIRIGHVKKDWAFSYLALLVFATRYKLHKLFALFYWILLLEAADGMPVFVSAHCQHCQGWGLQSVMLATEGMVRGPLSPAWLAISHLWTVTASLLSHDWPMSMNGHCHTSSSCVCVCILLSSHVWHTHTNTVAYPTEGMIIMLDHNSTVHTSDWFSVY